MLRSKGFSLVELLVAMAIFAIVAAGMIPIIIMAKKQNITSMVRINAVKVLEEEVAYLRSIDYISFNATTLSSAGYGNASPPSITEDLCRQPSVSTGCPSGYELERYGTRSRTVEIDSVNRTCSYVLKLCVDLDYLDPYLRKATLEVYYNVFGYEGRSDTDFYIPRSE